LGRGWDYRVPTSKRRGGKGEGLRERGSESKGPGRILLQGFRGIDALL